MVIPTERSPSPVIQHDVPESSSQTIQEPFESSILAISKLAADQEKGPHIKDCVDTIVNALPQVDFGLAQEFQDAFKNQLSVFEAAVDKTSNFEGKAEIKSDVKLACLQSLQEKWMAKGLKDYYFLFFLATHEERGEAALNWTHQFFVGSAYFNPTENPIQCISRPEIQKIQDSFASYYEHKMEKQGQVIARQVEQNHEAFYQRLMDLVRKAKKDSYSSLASADKELLEASIHGAASFTHMKPFRNVKVEMIKGCLDRGNALQKEGLSIQGEESQRLFLDMCTTLDQFISNYFREWKLKDK